MNHRLKEVSLKILLIDDEEGVLRALELLLRAFGHQVRAFQDSREVSAFLSAPDLELDAVISDLRMPHIDGFGVLALVQEHCPEIPFILISGHADEEEKARALTMGARCVVSKPFSPDQLADAFEEAGLLPADGPAIT